MWYVVKMTVEHSEIVDVNNESEAEQLATKILNVQLANCLKPTYKVIQTTVGKLEEGEPK